MSVFGCIFSIIGKKHLVIEWLSWLPNSSGFISYNILDTLTDICSTSLGLKIWQQRVHELVRGCSDSPVDNFVGSKRPCKKLQSGRVKFSKVEGCQFLKNCFYESILEFRELHYCFYLCEI